MEAYRRLKAVPKNSGVFTELKLKPYEVEFQGQKKLFLKGELIADLVYDETLLDVYGLQEDIFKESRFYLVLETNKRVIKIKLKTTISEFLDLIYHPKTVGMLKIDSITA